MQKYFIIPLLAAVMAAIWGCTNEENMGGDLVPSSDKSSINVIDTITINAYTLQEDTVYAANATYLPIGNLDDPIFGTATAAFAMKFSNTSYGSFYENSVIDSAVFTLGLDTLNRRFYGDSLETVTINAYRLTDTLEYSASYCQNYDISAIVDPTLIATATFVPAQCDTMLRMEMTKEFAYMIMNSCQDSCYDETCATMYFTMESKNCMMRFYASSKFTEYTLYHHAMGDTTVKEVSFSMSSVDPTLTLLSHDYSKTRFAEQLANPGTVQDDYLYLQAICGTRLKIGFPYIGALKNIDNKKFQMITNARLLMPLADSAFAIEGTYPVIDYIVPGATRNDGSGDFIPTDLLSVTSNSSGTSYSQRISYCLDYTNRRYSIDLTGVVKSMVDSCYNSLAPNYSITVFPSGRVIDFSRSIINSPTNAERPMKLVVEYMTLER